MVVLTENTTTRATTREETASDIRVEPTIWGYVVHCVGYRDTVLPLVRALTNVMGIALVFLAVALWVFPGATLAGETLLFKIGLSVVFFYMGLMLVQAGQAKGNPEVQLDMQRRELRMIERPRRGASKLVACHPFAHLSDIRLDDGDLVASDRSGEEVVRVRVDAPKAREQIEQRLRREVFGRA